MLIFYNFDALLFLEESIVFYAILIECCTGNVHLYTLNEQALIEYTI